mgnify:CR=1 FL=1
MIQLIILIALVVVLFFLLKKDFGQTIPEDKPKKQEAPVVEQKPVVVQQEAPVVEQKPVVVQQEAPEVQNVTQPQDGFESVMNTEESFVNDFEPVQEENNFAMF